MSRQVDLDGPLSDADRAYLLQRGRRHLVLQNDRQYLEGGDADDPSPAPQGSAESEQDSWEDEVNELTVEELKAELSDRGLSTSGNKAELQKRLIDAGPDDQD